MKSIDNPLVSIITVTFNSEEFLERTIKSVIAQTYKNIEHIIIDGGSKDGTLGIINKYINEIDHFISEADEGIYDAWNKGLALAKGDIIAFLNSDDYYDKDTVCKAVDTLRTEDDACLVYGVVRRICSKNNEITMEPVRSFRDSIKIIDLIKGFGFWHTSVFANRKCFKRTCFKFDKSFRIAGDFDWLLRAYVNKCRFKRSYHIVNMEVGGVSDRLWLNAFKEQISSVENQVGPISSLRKLLYFVFKYFSKYRVLRRIKDEISGLKVFVINFLLVFIPSYRLRNRFMRLFGSRIGKNSTLNRCVFIGNAKGLVLGSNSTINSGSKVDLRGGVNIGSNVTIASDVKIITAGHDINCPAFSYTTKPVYICDYAVIFSNSMICPGVHIGIGAVVLPGSVVVKSIADYEVVGGNPAIKVSKRDSRLNYSASFKQLMS